MIHGRPEGAPRARRFSALRDFLEHEAAGGYVLIAAAAMALLLANSPFAHSYQALLASEIGLHLGAFRLSETVISWVNDALMAVFFLLVGLEIKREILDGQLARPEKVMLPGLAALGGVMLPAFIYLGFNAQDAQAARGWAIPSATDIAFALAVLALAGPRVPSSLKVFLTAIAVLDDLAAILIIAVFYTAQLHLIDLVGAAGVLSLLILLSRLRVTQLWPYLLLGAVLWWLVLESGVHATLAGVALAFTIPLRPTPGRPDSTASPLHRLEHRLQKPVAFGVLPAFGLANAGLSFADVSLADLTAPVPLGIAFGLIFGKQLGVFSTAFVMIRLGVVDRPKFASTGQLYAVAVLCGIGFTMSLFIGGLAFSSPELAAQTKLGVFGGSLVSAILGLLLLKRFTPPAAEPASGAAGRELKAAEAAKL